MTRKAIPFFNTAGPIEAEIHYHLPPLSRLDVDHLLLLIRQEKYFVLHAPKQTGKTSALLALRDLLNGGDAGEYRCVYVNVEVAQAADVAAAMRAVLGEMAHQAEHELGDPTLGGSYPETLETNGPYAALHAILYRWSASDPRPLVLLIDEIDTLIGDSLQAVLRQLRTGYDLRPEGFPQSVVLCGMREVRDYRIGPSSEGATIPNAVPFNIIAESLRLEDFSPGEVDSLLAQHTAETGQAFTGEARATVWELTEGQPWLVNALAYEACFKNEAGWDRSREVTAEAIQEAREELILRRDLRQLTDKLQDERVRRVIEPLLSSADWAGPIEADDLQYVRDLGLVARDRPVRIANPMYREVIPRDLTFATQAGFAHDPAWYVGEDGALEVGRLLAAFQEYFREHSEHWVERFQYKEAGPQLLLQAFLQRMLSSGRIEREYGLGRLRTDLLLLWPLPGDAGTQKAVVACKVLHRGPERTLREGLEQTRAYMDRCGSSEGHLVIFDRTEGKSWEGKIYRRDETEGGAPVTVWGM